MTNYELIHGDCLQVLPTLEAGSVDAVITDPPYNAINRKTGGLRKIDKGIADSAPIDVDGLAAEFMRASRGSVYVWCSDEQYTAWVMAFKQRGATTRKCAWWKTNPSPMNGQRLWLSALELCVFARKSNAPFYKSCAHPVWRGPSERIEGHPTPKPVWLMREQIAASVPEGGVVLDPFMGSGTTGVACLQTGRRFIGIEKDITYYEIARQRLEAAAAQQRLAV
jgi:DNA modification methylase